MVVLVRHLCKSKKSGRYNSFLLRASFLILLSIKADDSQQNTPRSLGIMPGLLKSTVCDASSTEYMYMHVLPSMGTCHHHHLHHHHHHNSLRSPVGQRSTTMSLLHPVTSFSIAWASSPYKTHLTYQWFNQLSSSRWFLDSSFSILPACVHLQRCR